MADNTTYRYCQLIATGEPSSHQTLELRHRERTVLGRGTLTAILDENCCVEHAEVIADLSSKELHVKQLCSHSTIAGVSYIQKDESCTIGSGATIRLILDNSVEYTYNLFFGQRPDVINDDTENEYSCRWYTPIPSLLVMEYGHQTFTPLIAAFDLDGTLIKTKSGQLPFKATPDDWTFWDPCVPRKLVSTVMSGYRIVIFTNQAGMPYGNPLQEEFQIKVQSVMAALGSCPVTLIAALDDSEYRKPRTGMWSYFVQEKNEGVVNTEESFYVGDAAGRPSGEKNDGKRDFSCCDRKYAANLNLSFHLPEEYFLGEPPCVNFSWYGFNPRSYPSNSDEFVLEPVGSSVKSDRREVVVFVGPPAAGKTNFYTRHMKQYCHVNRDTLGSWQKCVSRCELALNAGQSVVIDNTSPDIESRARYVQVARQYCVPVRCMWFMTSIEHCLHNNHFRNHTQQAADPRSYKVVPDSAIRQYQRRFVEPSLTEGFSEIIKVTITLKFTDSKSRDLYMQFLD